jgi:iron(III) transport system permease protein
MMPTGAKHEAGAPAARSATPVVSLRRLSSTFQVPTNVIFLVVGITVAFLALYPTVFLFYGSLTDAPIGMTGKLTLHNYFQVFSDAETYSLMFNSICFALGSSTFSLLIGLTLAWITVRTNAPYKALFELTAIIPNVLPGLLVAMSWVFLLNPTNGLVNGICERLLGVRPFNIYSLWGLIWVEGLITAPLSYLILAAALKGMDPALEEAAKVSGSSEVGLTCKVTFPLVRPAILAAWTLNFVRAIESFDTPAIIAIPARFEVFTTKIFREAMGSFPSNHNLAATFAVALLVIAFFLSTFTGA